ncbi:unnamed protein product [Oikopleura dioica]|uniref:Reverse transcriptase domain-containing protein n=1 Tax=Oikopleura dioica TaxID=34765 RepID=E4WVP2_OIKDI|nr:unnamed protein product [Oikopleura dioica]
MKRQKTRRGKRPRNKKHNLERLLKKDRWQHLMFKSKPKLKKKIAKLANSSLSGSTSSLSLSIDSHAFSRGTEDSLTLETLQEEDPNNIILTPTPSHVLSMTPLELGQLSPEQSLKGVFNIRGPNFNLKLQESLDNDNEAEWRAAYGPNYDKILDILNEHAAPPANFARNITQTSLCGSLSIPRDKAEKIFKLMPEPITSEDFVRKGGNSVLPPTVAAFRTKCHEAAQHRDNMARFFRVKGRHAAEIKESWFTLILHHTELIYDYIVKLEQTNPTQNDLIALGLWEPNDFKHLQHIRNSLFQLIQVKRNAQAVMEIYAGAQILMYAFIPAPRSYGVLNFVRNKICGNTDYISDQHRTKNANQFLRYLMDLHNIVILPFKKFNTVVGQFSVDDNGKPKFWISKKCHVLVSSEMCDQKIITNNKFPDTLYAETIKCILIRDYKIHPNDINFMNIDNVEKKSEKAWEWLIEFQKNCNLNNRYFDDFIINNDPNNPNPSIIRSSKAEIIAAKPTMNEKRLRDLLMKGKIFQDALPSSIPSPLCHAKPLISSELFSLLDNRWKTRKKDLPIVPPSSANPKTNDGSLKIRDITVKTNDFPTVKNPTASEIKEMRELCKALNNHNKKKLSRIKCINFNPGIISRKGEILRDLAYGQPNTDLFFLNELRCKNELLNDSSCWPQGFSIHSHASLPHNDLQYSAIMTRDSTITDLIKEKFSVGPLTGILLENDKGEKLLTFSIYRPIPKEGKPNCFYAKYPRSDPKIFLSWIKEILLLAKSRNAPIILAGDFNIDFDRFTGDLELLLELKKLIKHLTDLCIKPTFYKKNCKNSIIDHVMVTNPRKTNCKNLRLHATLGTDGHCGQAFEYCFGVQPVSYKLTLRRILDPQSSIKSTALKEFTTIKHSIDSAKDPRSAIRGSFNSAKKLLMKCSHSLLEIKVDKNEFALTKGKDTIHYEEFKKVLSRMKAETKPPPGHEIHHLIKRIGTILAKLRARDKRISREKLSGRAESDRNVIWDIYREECSPNQLWNVDREFSAEELADKVVTLQEKTTADNVLTKPLVSDCKEHKLERFKYSINGETKHPSILGKYLKLKNHTRGWSGINKFFLDCLPVSLLNLLVISPIMNCLDHGEYPEELRNSRITILPKKMMGIRPIAIGECLTSVLEKVIISSVTKFLEGISAFPDSQAGFRSNMSCGSALFSIFKAYFEMISDKLCLSIVFVDCANAFGSISHDSLKIILSFYFSGRALKILTSSLHRNFVVNSNGFYSKLKRGTPHGVPQGGTLSPSLFCLYISQLANLPFLDTTKRLLLFADDTCLVIGAANYSELVKKTDEAVELLEETVADLGLKLVASKTNIMVFGKDSKANFGQNLEFTVSGEKLKPVQNAKYLGSTLKSEKGRMSMKRNTDLLTNKLKGINAKAGCIQTSLSISSNASLLRACSIGAYQHNLQITPPLSRDQAATIQSIYANGLNLASGRRIGNRFRQSIPTKKYRANIPLHRYQRITKKLEIVKQPAIWNVKIRSVLCHINGVISSGQSHQQCSFLLTTLKPKRWSKSIPLPRIPHWYRSRLSLERIDDLRSINIWVDPITIQRELVDVLAAEMLLSLLIESQTIDLEISIPSKLNWAECRNSLWPLFAKNWIDEVPKEVRLAMFTRHKKNDIKTFFKNLHVHVEDSVFCHQCRPVLIPPKFNEIQNNLQRICQKAVESLHELLNEHNIQFTKDHLFQSFPDPTKNAHDPLTLFLNCCNFINENSELYDQLQIKHKPCISGIILIDQLISVSEKGISLNHIDYYIAINLNTKLVKLVSTDNCSLLNEWNKGRNIVFIPSGVIKYGSGKGLSWAEQLEDELEELRINLAVLTKTQLMINHDNWKASNGKTHLPLESLLHGPSKTMQTGAHAPIKILSLISNSLLCKSGPASRETSTSNQWAASLQEIFGPIKPDAKTDSTFTVEMRWNSEVCSNVKKITPLEALLINLESLPPLTLGTIGALQPRRKATICGSDRWISVSRKIRSNKTVANSESKECNLILNALWQEKMNLTVKSRPLVAAIMTEKCWDNDVSLQMETLGVTSLI